MKLFGLHACSNSKKWVPRLNLPYKHITDYPSDVDATQHRPRRSGILETVQAIPTSTAPTARGNARGNTSLSSIDNKEKLLPVKTTLALKTNFSSPINNYPAISSESNIRRTSNGPQNLVSYSLDAPNSFPQPTSIPAIDTLSVKWPTPMGSIDNEMNNMEIPPTLQPIAKEMSSEEKIPEIEGIASVGRIPLSFEEEPSWKRSHTMSGNVMSGHEIHGHASHTVKSTKKNGHASLSVNSVTKNGHASHSVNSMIKNGHGRHSVNSMNMNGKKLVVMNDINETIANTRRHVNVANLRVYSKRQDGLSSSKRTSSKFGKRKKTESKYNNSLLQRTNKDKKAENTAQPCSFNPSSNLKKKVFIPPPEPIGPIQPLLEKFEKEKAVGDISEHTLDFENIKPHEAIDKHLLSIKSQPKIGPIKEHLLTDQIDPIEPIAKHQVKANAL